MVDRLEEHPDVYFSSSSSQFYEWVEEHDPQLLSDIRTRVEEGRWELCGGWPVQPDCNIPSGEAFARHSLIGQHTFHRLFGTISKTGWCVDSFGHTASLPQILALSRMKRYVFMRPDDREKPLDWRTFLWQSPDGSRVLAYRIPFSYCAWGGLEQIMDNLIEQVRRIQSLPLACFYGVGNHGGGPTNENIALIREKARTNADIQFKFATIDQFLCHYETDGPPLGVLVDDLQHHASGCYAAHSGIKEWNNNAEQALLRAEKMSVLSAFLTGTPYRGPELEHAWKQVLFNQFHDILAGTSIREAYDDARQQLGEAVSIAHRVENYAIQRISRAINIPFEEGAVPVVVFNPHPWAVHVPIEIEWGKFLNTQLPQRFTLENPQGSLVDYQRIAPNVEERDRTKILFNARLEGLGYRVFTIRPDHSAEITKQGDEFIDEPSSLRLENRYVVVSFDRGCGGITSIVTKPEGRELLSSPAAVGSVFNDSYDTWAHTTLSFDDFIGQFIPYAVEKIEDGPVRQTIRVASRFGQSILIQEYSLLETESMIRVRAYVDWREPVKGLKLLFPTTLHDPHATLEIPFATIDKETDGVEQPMQGWIHISEASGAGIAIVNTSKYSASVSGATVGITVVRNPPYSHHKETPLPLEADRYHYVDWGVQEFTYAIVPHEALHSHAQLSRMRFELNQSPVVIVESFHQGRLPQDFSLLSIESDHESVVATSLKEHFSGSGYVLRVYEAQGIGARAMVHVPNQRWNVEIKPWEIKTFHVDASLGYVGELDFLEWPKEQEELQSVDNESSV